MLPTHTGGDGMSTVNPAISSDQPFAESPTAIPVPFSISMDVSSPQAEISTGPKDSPDRFIHTPEIFSSPHIGAHFPINSYSFVTSPLSTTYTCSIFIPSNAGRIPCMMGKSTCNSNL